MFIIIYMNPETFAALQAAFMQGILEYEQYFEPEIRMLTTPQCFMNTGNYIRLLEK